MHLMWEENPLDTLKLNVKSLVWFDLVILDTTKALLDFLLHLKYF